MVDDQLFHKSLHMVDMVMQRVRPEDMDKPTPCSEWNVRALMNHITSETGWVEPLLQGRTIADVGTKLDGDLLGANPYPAWREYMANSMNAASLANPEEVAHLSYGDKSVQAYLDEVGGDLIIHGWDLAKAVGAPYVIDDATCASVKKGTEDIMPSGRESGYVAAALTVNDSAGAMEKLLAYYGRDINWGQ